MFSHVKSILFELHVLLTCNKEHQNVFTEVPFIGFKNAKSLKDHLVRGAVPKIDENSKSEPCLGKRSPGQVCNSIENTCTFPSFKKDQTFSI